MTVVIYILLANLLNGEDRFYDLLLDFLFADDYLFA